MRIIVHRTEPLRLLGRAEGRAAVALVWHLFCGILPCGLGFGKAVGVSTGAGSLTTSQILMLLRRYPHGPQVSVGLGLRARLSALPPPSLLARCMPPPEPPLPEPAGARALPAKRLSARAAASVDQVFDGMSDEEKRSVHELCCWLLAQGEARPRSGGCLMLHARPSGCVSGEGLGCRRRDGLRHMGGIPPAALPAAPMGPPTSGPPRHIPSNPYFR